MKREMFAACALAVALFMLAGCSNGKTAGTPEEDAVKDPEIVTDGAENGAATDVNPGSDDSTDGTDSEAGSDGSVSESRTIAPLPSGIDMAHLDDCTVAVSFEKGDAYVDDTGAMQLKVKVYVYDVYDMVDISMLQVGDQITICGQDVKVTSLERDDSGAVVINGGVENGGYELVSDEDSGFYAVGLDDLKLYYALGEATIPVSEDFQFEDASDPEKDPVTYYPGDFLTDYVEIEYNFVPNNTSIVIQGGYVIRMQRVYNP